MIAAPAPRGLHAPDVAAPVEVASRPSLGTLWEVIAEVPDPEIPVVSVVELGILRGIEWDPADSSTLVVTVTPTYSGCPATEVIMASIRYALFAAGVDAAPDRNAPLPGVDDRLDDARTPNASSATTASRRRMASARGPSGA